MLRKSTRQRKEYLYQKALEDKEKTVFENRKRLRDALENNKPLPTDLRNKSGDKLRKGLDLADDVTKEQHQVIDDEYAYIGVKDPKVVITTGSDPSSRLMSFVKELRLLIPNSQRINRGSGNMKELVELARKNDVSDIIFVHEHRGEPDGLIISHLPYGPTCYFQMKNVTLRHDLATKPAPMSEAAPHLIFEKFESSLGTRVKTVLQALFPPAAPLCNRAMVFANHRDTIHFRHYNYGTDAREKEQGDNDVKRRKTAAKKEGLKEQDVELREVGPRFSLVLYKIDLGTIDMVSPKTEWVLRPYFNKQKDALDDVSRGRS